MGKPLPPERLPDDEIGSFFVLLVLVVIMCAMFAAGFLIGGWR
jgi:hypothetical protein